MEYKVNMKNLTEEQISELSIRGQREYRKLHANWSEEGFKRFERICRADCELFEKEPQDLLDWQKFELACRIINDASIDMGQIEMHELFGADAAELMKEEDATEKHLEKWYKVMDECKAGWERWCRFTRSETVRR